MRSLLALLLTATSVLAANPAILTLEQSSDNMSTWQAVPMTAAMLTADGRLVDTATSGSSKFYRMRIGTPSATTSGTLSNFISTIGTSSAAQTFTVSGSNLIANLVVTAPSGCEVSTNGTNYTSSLTLTPSSGGVAATTVYLRIAASTAAGLLNGYVMVTSTGAATQNIGVSGLIVEALVTVQGGTLTLPSQLAGQSVSAFSIGKHEVTWDQWQSVQSYAVAHGYDLEWIGGGSMGNHPVRDVNWFDAVKWCNAKSEMEGLTPVYQVGGATYRMGQSSPNIVTGANGYRLPSESEWEWAARGGVSTHGYTYSGSNDVNAVGWYWENSVGAPMDLGIGHGTWPVGQKQVNELGLYDMSGNVSEWCFDSVNGSSDRRLRGGGWGSFGGGECAVSTRSSFDPYVRRGEIGLRPVRSLGN